MAKLEMILLLLLSLIATLSIGFCFAIHKGNEGIISNQVNILECERIIRTEGGRYVSLDNIKKSDRWHKLNNAEKKAVMQFFQEQHLAEPYVSILYRPKRRTAEATRIMIDCFDGKGKPMERRSQKIPTSSELIRGAIKRINIKLPPGTASFEIK